MRVLALTPADWLVFASGHSMDEMYTWVVGVRLGNKIQDAVLVNVPAKTDPCFKSSLLVLVFAHSFPKAQNS